MFNSVEQDINDQQDDLFEHYKIVVDKGQQPLRIDRFLFDKLPNTTRNKIQNAASAGTIRCNEKPVKSSYKVKPGDVISVVLPYPPRIIELIPENIPLVIIYEDDELAVVQKPANLVVHPGYGNYTGTLVNGLIYHFQHLPQPQKTCPERPVLSVAEGRRRVKKDESDMKEDEQWIRPGLVHRLDKNTTGLLVVAKSDIALTKLAKQFFDRTVDRTYIALVWGDLKMNEGTVSGNVGRNLKNRKVMAVFPKGDFGKHAVTHYKVLERFGYVTLIECKLETGRTHQIRVHLKHIGHPLFNDNEYGGDSIVKGLPSNKYNQFVKNCFKMLPRQALHARSLGFEHPHTGKRMYFDSEIPNDMAGVIEKWRWYSNSRKE